MLELINAAAAPVLIPYTTLLVVVMIYWLSVIVGAIDLSAFDFDLDFDADVDVDLDADTDVDSEVSTGWLAGALHFFNFGRLPFMVIFSVVVLVSWSLAILGNYYLGHNSWGFALATFIPNLFVSLIAAKLLTTPLAPLFEKMDGSAEPVDYIGQTCKIRLPAGAGKFGQAEVMIDDASLLINVKTESDALILRQGETGLVTGKTSDGRYYIVRPLKEEPRKSTINNQ